MDPPDVLPYISKAVPPSQATSTKTLRKDIKIRNDSTLKETIPHAHMNDSHCGIAWRGKMHGAAPGRSIGSNIVDLVLLLSAPVKFDAHQFSQS